MAIKILFAVVTFYSGRTSITTANGKARINTTHSRSLISHESKYNIHSMKVGWEYREIAKRKIVTINGNYQSENCSMLYQRITDFLDSNNYEQKYHSNMFIC